HTLEPDTAQAIYRRVRAGYEQGLETRGIAEELRPIINAAVSRHLSRADDDVLVEMASLFAEQLSALLEIEPRLCFDYVAAGPQFQSAIELLPAPLIQREIALNERVLRSSRDRLFPDQG